MSHIQVDRPTCEGIGMCETQANEYFQIGDDGIVNLSYRYRRNPVTREDLITAGIPDGHLPPTLAETHPPKTRTGSDATVTY